MPGNRFVFVVSGAREHLDTLHFSLRYLRHFSKNEIIVVTDPERNEIPVEHPNVVEVKTPESFTHHQASIYLKTGLHKFLPKGYNYCYLDTDVVALSEECDDIFNHQQGIVSFAPDHCRMPKFSPNAVKCDCLQRNKLEIAELESLMERYDPARKLKDPLMAAKKENLIRKFEVMQENKLSYFFIALRFLASFNKFKLDDDTYYDRWKKIWHDKEGRVIITYAESMVADIEKNSTLRWNTLKRRWVGVDGKDVFNLECSHLPEYIHNRFGIMVRNQNFQHWNGGVFLFNDSSHAFMEAWFNKTMQIFTYPEWKIRDQGTLIATVWEFGLQNNPMLSKKFNFIADWNNHKLNMNHSGHFTDDAFKNKYLPAFIHIYHNFGKRGWEIWDYVEKLQLTF